MRLIPGHALLGSEHFLVDALVAVVVLAAVARYAHAAFVFEVGRDVVVDIAVNLGALGTPCGAAAGPALHRVAAHNPVADVDVVQVLLDDLVAAQPQVGVPVAVLPFEVAPALLAAVGVLDYRAADPIGVQRHHIAQFAAVHLGDHVEVERIAAPLRAADHGQFLLLRLFGGGHEAADMHRVGAERLLAEDVLIGIDRGFEMNRAPGRRRGQKDDVHARTD